MPFATFDPIRHYSTLSVVCPPNVTIPTTDDVAWMMNPRHNHVHNKLELARTQGLSCAPHGIYPDKYPIVSKPIMNLDGGSAEARVMRDEAEYERYYRTGSMWCEYLSGPHLSIDLAIIDGNVVWSYAMKGEKSRWFGCFDFWRTIELPKDTEEMAAQWVGYILRGYTGMCNIEMIGNYVTDAHLRDGDAGVFGGASYFESVVQLYTNGQWPGVDVPNGYIAPVFDVRRSLRAIELVDRREFDQYIDPPDITSIRVDELDDRHANPPDHERLLVVQGTNEERVRAVRDEIRANLQSLVS